MKIQFGESVRRLRLEKSLTQEALAAQLHVSFQTVSKWERNESYPDLTMLPVLAQFFGVRTDDLLGVDEAENERRVQEIMDAYESYRLNAEHLPRLKAAVEEYPLDYRLWVRYMECLLIHTKGENTPSVEKEVRKIYENIVAHCTDDNIRMRAKRIYVMYINALAHRGKAELQQEVLRILSEMPDMLTCREHLALMLAPDQETRLQACQEELVALVWMIWHAIYHHAEYGLPFPHEEATHPRAEAIIYGQEVFLRLVDLFYPDGDYGAQAVLVMKACGFLAFYHAISGETDAAFDAMGRSVELACSIGKQQKIAPHTSPLLRGLDYDSACHAIGYPKIGQKHHPQEMRRLFNDRYPWPEEFRQDERFSELLEQLSSNCATGG